MKKHLLILMLTVVVACSKTEEPVPLENEDLSQIIVCTPKTVYAVDTVGKILWNKTDLKAFTGNPFIKDKTVYVPVWPLVALNLTDGMVKKTFKNDVLTGSNFFIKDNTILTGELRAYNLDTETKNWSLKSALYSQFVTSGENVFIMNFTDYKMLCVDIKTGATVWENQLTKVQGSSGLLQPVITTASVVSHGLTKNLIAFDLKTGNQLWDYTSEDNTSLGQISYADNMILINKQKEIVAIDANNGKKIWAYKKQFTFSGIQLRPFVLNDKIFIGDGNQCIALNKSNGMKIWGITNQSNQTISTVVAHKKTLYYNDGLGYICALNVDNGNLKWRTKLGEITSSFFHYTSPILITQSGRAIYPN